MPIATLSDPDVWLDAPRLIALASALDPVPIEMELADVPVSDDWPIAIELVPPAVDPRPSEIALVAVAVP